MRLAAAVYGLVSGALLLRLFAGLLVSLRILRRSHPTGITAEGAEVRESDHIASPVTIGCFALACCCRSIGATGIRRSSMPC